jgi:TonB family protein
MRRGYTGPHIFLLAALLLALPAQSWLPEGKAAGTLPNHKPAAQDVADEWLRVNPRGEEISVLTPHPPNFVKQRADYLLREGGERILEHRSYSGYGGDFVFTIESYRAARPQKIAKDLERYVTPRATFEQEITLGDFSGRQYRLNRKDVHGKVISVVTKKHVYLITLAAREENSQAAARFLNALLLGDGINAPATAEALDLRESAAYKNALSGKPEMGAGQDDAFSSKEVTRRALIVHRPEPLYSEEARRNRVAGTVILRVVLGAGGEVKDVTVKRGLDSGLTEKAVEAALLMRFFPAEKDGRPVSQYVQVEYNFDIY